MPAPPSADNHVRSAAVESYTRWAAPCPPRPSSASDRHFPKDGCSVFAPALSGRIAAIADFHLGSAISILHTKPHQFPNDSVDCGSQCIELRAIDLQLCRRICVARLDRRLTVGRVNAARAPIAFQQVCELGPTHLVES